MEPGHTVEHEPARSRPDRQFFLCARVIDSGAGAGGGWWRGLGSEYSSGEAQHNVMQQPWPLTNVDHALHRLRALRHVQQVPESFEVDAPCVVRDGVRQHHTVVHLRRHREEVVV